MWEGQEEFENDEEQLADEKVQTQKPKPKAKPKVPKAKKKAAKPKKKNKIIKLDVDESNIIKRPRRKKKVDYSKYYE